MYTEIAHPAIANRNHVCTATVYALFVDFWKQKTPKVLSVYIELSTRNGILVNNADHHPNSKK